MRLLRTKVWSWVDLVLLKWCCVLVGMIAGAYFSEVVRSYVWIFAAAALLLGIRPTLAYFGGDPS